ncbi:MAG: VWA domain-containing protein [Halovenus sp.]
MSNEENGDVTEPPLEAEIEDEIRMELVRFVRDLRRAGVAVPANGAIVAGEVLREVGFGDRERARAGLQAALLSRVEDIQTFEPLFDRFWRGLQRTLDPDRSAPPREPRSDDEGGLEPMDMEEGNGDETAETTDTSEEGSPDTFGFVGSEAADQSEQVHETAEYSPGGVSTEIRARPGDDADRTKTAVNRLTLALAALPGRRPQPMAAGRRPNVRQALRDSISTGGVLTSVPESGPKPTEVNGLALADVSRSVLDVLDRDFLVRFLWALTDLWRQNRIFFFDHEAREVTSAFETPTTDAAVDSLRAAEAAWGGGTRIGNAITTARDAVPTAVDRRTVVLIISDGLEMGDVEELETGMAWLADRASEVFWLNPLANSSEYEPTAAGMAAALPYIDGLFAFTSPGDVLEMARQLRQYDGDALVSVHGETSRH